jgi:hypothetical protein
MVPPVQIDPLDSPYPVPWNWILAMLSASQSSQSSKQFSYRSPTLISPDQTHAAYSRIQLHAEPDYYRSYITSVLFVENLQTGDLQPITPTSPLADNPFLNRTTHREGQISMVVPVSWSETGDRLLAREFESMFGSSLASDYGVIADLTQQQVKTIAPTRIHYTNAVLLGWSQQHPERALFRAGMMGDQYWQQWTVDSHGNTNLAIDDHPLVCGQPSTTVWTGPQVQENLL